MNPMLITIKAESYLTISKIVSHFKHGQNKKMKNSYGCLSLTFERKLKFVLFIVISDSYMAPGNESLYI